MTSGLIGSLVATTCIFLPTFIFVVIIATHINKFKDNFYLKSLIKGANAAALGAILSTAFLLSKDAILDVPTLILFIASASILISTKFKEYYLIIISAAAGILIKMIL
jgi:chromate transporter